MARIRTIKPETFTSDDVDALTIHARWTWVGLWTHADDEGRARADPRLIKAAVWPIDDTVSPADVTSHLDEMERRGMICRYSVDGVAYLHVVNFSKHQRINRPSPSKHPACSRDVHGGLSEDSVSPPPPLPDDSRPEQGTGNREGEQGTGTPTACADEPRGEVFEAEIVETTNLPAVVSIPNAGQLTRAWIDHCATNGVKLPTSTIKRYGKHIGDAMKQGFPVDLIKRALAQMLTDGEASRPSLFDNYLVRAQSGPARGPRKLTPGETTVARWAHDPAVQAGIADMLANYGPKAEPA